MCIRDRGGVSGIAASTYPLEDADMLAAEAAYCAMEDLSLIHISGRRNAPGLEQRRLRHDPNAVGQCDFAHRGRCPGPVSYTHLDVYKRQTISRR